MGKTLKQYAGKRRVAAIVVSVLGGLVLLFSLVMAFAFADDAQEEAVPYETVYQTAAQGDYVSVVANYASISVANFIENEDVNFYVVFTAGEDGMDCYLVCGDNRLGEKLATLQDYTYGESNIQPQPVTVAGCLVEIDRDLVEYTLEECDYLLGEGVIPREEFFDYFGYYYIDATQTAADAGLVTFFAVVALLALGCILAAWYRRFEITACTRRTRFALGEAAWQAAEQEMNESGENRPFPATGAVLTRHYCISWGAGIQIVPVEQILGIHGVSHGNKGALCFVLNTGRTVTLPPRSLKKEAVRREYAELVGLLSERKPDIYYGKQNLVVEGRVNLADIPEFYVVDTTKGIALNDTAFEGGEAVAPDYGAGVVGAIGGALLGMIVWVLVGTLGFISGWIGALTVYLALRGFKKLGGRLDKTGALISTVIAVVAIPLATGFCYVIALVQAGSHITLGYALTHLFSLLELYDVTSSFIADTVMGLVFTLLVGVPLTQKALKAGQQRVITDAKGNHIYVKETPGVTDENGDFVSDCGKGQTVGLVACAVAGLLFLVIAVMGLLDEGWDPVFIICLIPVALFVAAAVVMYRQSKQKIVYNEQGIAYYQSRHVISVAWPEVTELRLRNLNRLVIVTPQGKITFHYGWRNYEHLMAFAASHATNAENK